MASLLAVSAMSILPLPAQAQAQTKGWVGTWAASPQPTWGADFPFPTNIPHTVRDTTFRQVIKVSLGGDRLRLVFSNRYGTTPLKIGAATIAMPGLQGGPTTDHMRKITFAGHQDVTLSPGAQAVSDPIQMTVVDGAKLVISTWLPDKTPLQTLHWDGRETAWFGKTNLTMSADFPRKDTTDARILLSEVLVDTPNNGAVVAVGDSITDGNGVTIDSNSRWTDFLAARLAPQRIAVLNAGISGNRLLQDKMGVNALARLNQDVFSQPHLKAIVLLIGVNDIAWPGTKLAPSQSRPTVDAMIAGYQQFIAQAHAHNVQVIGATLTPFKSALSGTPLADYYSRDKDAVRQRINHWIRESGAFDAVVDVDRLLRDPKDSARLAPTYDSGDHLHPGKDGNAAIANAIPLDSLLRP